MRGDRLWGGLMEYHKACFDDYAAGASANLLACELRRDVSAAQPRTWTSGLRWTGQRMRSHAMNLGKALKRYGIPYPQKKVDEGKASGKLQYFSADDVKAIVRDVLHNNFMKLGEDAAVSGEWLVFAEHDGKYYYLSLATHDTSQHGQVRQAIDAICCREFPFLTTLLSGA